MSEFERNKGKLTPVYMTENTKEQFATQVINGELPSYYDSYWEMLFDNAEEYGYAEIGDKLYRLEMEDVDDDAEYCNVTKNDDGSFSFESYHYNGGAHWTELLEGKLN